MDNKLSAKEQAQKLYEEFAVIFHPTYFDIKFKVNCKQAKECAKKTAQLLISYGVQNQILSPEIETHWNEVISEIDKINEKEKS